MKLTAAVEAYCADLGRVRASGGATGERSSYGPLANLLNAVGVALKPKVFCVGELADQGAGHRQCGRADGRRRRESGPAALRGELRHDVRRLPDPRIERENPTPSPQPRREPPSELRVAHGRHLSDAHRRTNPSLCRTAYSARPVQTRGDALPEAIRGTRDLPRPHRHITYLTNMRASKGASSPLTRSPTCSRATPLRSAWMARADGWTTCSSSVCGAASSTRTCTCVPTKRPPSFGQVWPATSVSTTPSAVTAHWTDAPPMRCTSIRLTAIWQPETRGRFHLPHCPIPGVHF